MVWVCKGFYRFTCWGQIPLATFNIADSLICVGVSIMVFTSFSKSKHKDAA